MKGTPLIAAGGVLAAVAASLMAADGRYLEAGAVVAAWLILAAAGRVKARE